MDQTRDRVHTHSSILSRQSQPIIIAVLRILIAPQSIPNSTRSFIGVDLLLRVQRLLGTLSLRAFVAAKFSIVIGKGHFARQVAYDCPVINKSCTLCRSFVVVVHT